MCPNFGRKFWRVPGHHLHIKHDADPWSKLGGWPFKEFAYVPALTLIENGPYNHACCPHPEAWLWRHNVYNYIRRRHGSSPKWSMFRIFFVLWIFSVLCWFWNVFCMFSEYGLVKTIVKIWCFTYIVHLSLFTKRWVIRCTNLYLRKVCILNFIELKVKEKFLKW